MKLLITLFQEVDIDKKLQEAPDSSYSIGVFIGTMLPFVALVIIAYSIYRYNKKKLKEK